MLDEPVMLHFQPYQTDEIVDIIKGRLMEANANIMDSAAMELCARKIAAVGDLRKALDICNVSIDLANRESQGNVTAGIKLTHVLTAMNRLFTSQNSIRIKGLNLHSKIIMAAFTKLLQLNAKNITVGELHDTYISFCNQSRLSSCVSRSEFFDLISNLQSSGIFSISKSKDERSKKITTQISIQDIKQGIQDISILTELLNQSDMDSL